MLPKRKQEGPTTALTLRHAFNKALRACETRHNTDIALHDYKLIWEALVGSFSDLGYTKFSADENAPKEHLFPASTFEGFEDILDPWVKKVAEAKDASAKLPTLMAQRMIASASMKRFKDGSVNED